MASRRWFAAGAWVLVALGIVHIGGHVMMVSSTGTNDTERQMLELMRTYKTDFGAGFVRSTADILAGFSLTFSVLSAGFGLLDLVLLRHARTLPALLRPAALVNALVFGAMTVVGLRYWFAVPLTFLAVAFLCFALAVAFAGVRTERAGEQRRVVAAG